MKRRRLLLVIPILLIAAAVVFGTLETGSINAATGGNGKGGGNGKSQGQNHRLTPKERQQAANRLKTAMQDAGLTAIPVATMMAGATPDYFGTTPNWAHSPLPSGPVASITLISGGSGYSATPTVTISDAYGAVPTATATATATVTNGEITAITIGTNGDGYVAPVVMITDATGTGALATAAIGTAGGVSVQGGIRKFVQPLPTLQAATPEPYPAVGSAPAADYYWIGLVQFDASFSPDLPATSVRGYVQLTTNATAWPLNYPNGGGPILYGGQQLYAMAQPQYLGPTIVAQKDKPVRIKFTNLLPTATGGDLFLPVDDTLMGAGMGPTGAMYSSNRATLHLHGGVTPWISDGTMHQWTTPYGSSEAYPKGVSVRDVPDMGTSGQGDLTFYYTNQQSARLMFYHDHSYGITRLNVYAGEAAGYLVQDSAEASLISQGAIPADEMPLVIQDKTFVDASTIGAQDPTWAWGTTPGTAHTGDLWFPHVYMPNQNPGDIMGSNAMGRWDYGPWFWPPYTGLTHGPVANPLYDPLNAPWENAENPGTPNPSVVPEAFMDTPVVNGVAYPYLQVDQKAYRFRILNACNDRFLNLQLYFAASNGQMWDASGVLLDGNAGEVPMVPAIKYDATTSPGTKGYSSDITDGRDGGVPDARAVGPSMIQIGTEGGFLPNPAVLPNTPIGYDYNRRSITVLNVSTHTLFLGPAERADVIIDFSGVPAGTKLILYNDAPAPVPAFDPRNDYYTGDPDSTSTGGAPTTVAGYGPNTRTLMQFQVSGATGNPANLNLLKTALPAAYGASQPLPVIGQARYNAAFGAAYPLDAYVRIQDTQKSFQSDSVGSVTVTNGGGGYTSAPTVTLSPPQAVGGVTATALATLAPAAVGSLTLSNGGSNYTTAPTVSFSGGGGSGAAATTQLAATGRVKTITVNNGGSGYKTAPTVTFTGGGGSGAQATATIQGGKVTAVTVTNGGANYSSAPTIGFTGGSGTGASATATLGKAVATITLTNGGTNYTSAPTVVFSGNGTGAAATATLAPAPVGSVTVTNGGSGYLAAPTVTFSSGTATATASLANIAVAFRPKAIQELFNPDYGQMNATLGVEVPNTNATIQTTIPYYMVDPPTEIFDTKPGPTPAGQLIQSLPDGTQIWKITHNGVDTHAIHFHMMNAQLINRVGWDGMVKPPDDNEIGWKDTIRMNPLEDIIVALRPIVPTLPWSLPNSIRPLDAAMPLGASDPNEFLNVDPTNQPATVTNSLVNFGWEYVWHCHLLGHEENDMMRPIAFGVAPNVPTIGTAAKSGSSVKITFTDNSNNETGFLIQRATATGGPWTTIGTFNRPVPTQNPDLSVNDFGLTTGGTVTFTDTAPVKKATNYYRVIAIDVLGYTQTYAAPAVGYPIETIKSAPSGNSNGVAM